MRTSRSLTRVLPVLLIMLLVAALPPITAADARPLAGVLLVIDPGHGGNDFGVDPAGSGLQEKAVVLDIAQRLARLAQAEGASVALTRTSDRYVSLAARVRYANALLFRPDNAADGGRLISVHVNSNRKNPTLRRVEVLVDPAATGSFAFAADLAARLRAATGGTVGYRDAGYPDGVHPADVAPVRWTFPRGHNVLTESAFLSNPEQARRLRDPAFLEAIARAHLDALRAELGR